MMGMVLLLLLLLMMMVMVCDVVDADWFMLVWW